MHHLLYVHVFPPSTASPTSLTKSCLSTWLTPQQIPRAQSIPLHHVVTQNPVPSLLFPFPIPYPYPYPFPLHLHFHPSSPKKRPAGRSCSLSRCSPTTDLHNPYPTPKKFLSPLFPESIRETRETEQTAGTLIGVVTSTSTTSTLDFKFSSLFIFLTAGSN